MTNDNKESNSKLTRRERYKQLVYENWQANREMGMKRYIIQFGVFSWGVATFVFYWILMFIFNKLLKLETGFSFYQMLFSLLFFVVFGAVYGFILWHRNEKLFNAKYPYGKKNASKKLNK